MSKELQGVIGFCVIVLTAVAVYLLLSGGSFGGRGVVAFMKGNTPIYAQGQGPKEGCRKTKTVKKVLGADGQMHRVRWRQC